MRTDTLFNLSEPFPWQQIFAYWLCLARWLKHLQVYTSKILNYSRLLVLYPFSGNYADTEIQTMVNTADITQLKNNRITCTEMVLIQLHRQKVTQFSHERALAH